MECELSLDRIERREGAERTPAIGNGPRQQTHNGSTAPATDRRSPSSAICSRPHSSGFDVTIAKCPQQASPQQLLRFSLLPVYRY